MTRAVTLLVAFTLTGMPATLACLMSCDPAATTMSASECHHQAPAPAERGVGAAAGACGAPTIEPPFLVETTPRALGGPAAQPAVVAIRLTSAAAARPDPIGFLKGPADRSLPPPQFSAVLRI